MTLFDSIEIYASEVEEIHTRKFLGLKRSFSYSGVQLW